MRNHHCELAAKNCQRIRAILFELQATLNFEAGGEIAKRLDGIYAFMILEVTKASLQQDADRLHALLRVIRPLREGWQGVPRQFAHTTSLTGDTHANVISMRT
jgi:flagellar biosynthetic protein FliS